MSPAPEEPGRSRDSGMTLVELLVAMSIGIVVLLLVGATMYRTLVTQRDVTSLTQATNQAQTAAASVERSVRNATAVSHLTTPSGVEILRMRTRTGSAGGASTRCEAYAYDPSAHTLRRTTAASAIDPATSSTWSLIIDKVSPSTGTALLPLTTVAGRSQVALSFSVAAGKVKPVEVESVVYPLPSSDTGSAPCF
ncbi:prepilin-type N-terminal cleavage/methylation domain-containing protein [Cellulomonas sp. ES6]|uniref:PilW family protein n=1 Tax=Cellulomonas sp. ES6 TaxID=3039384 RepID=UPI0024B7442E|nr:prepilin-type N-terminal cleavage/methylation domain-containing protein [Cellulomonas sp. ES6]WHP17777.1 prepilin-type N-terminal cleavage/methylation domain-containing protein [Cellulomonas sp. ES6]